jgi:hypothetical protein
MVRGHFSLGTLKDDIRALETSLQRLIVLGYIEGLLKDY